MTLKSKEKIQKNLTRSKFKFSVSELLNGKLLLEANKNESSKNFSRSNLIDLLISKSLVEESS